jgi:hypothetical protein
VPPRPPRLSPSAGNAFEGALQAAISVVLGMVGGYYADRYFGTGYVLSFIGLVLGGVAAVRRLLLIKIPDPQDPRDGSTNRDSTGSTDRGGPSTVRRGDSHADRGEDGSGG